MRLGRMGDILIAGFPVLLFQLAQHLFQQCARIIQVDVLVPQIQPHLIQHLRLEIGLFLGMDGLQRHPAVMVEQGLQPLALVLVQHAFGQHRLHHVAQLGFKCGQVQLGQRLSRSQRVQPVDDLHHAGGLPGPEGRNMPGPAPSKDRLLRLPRLQLGTLPVDLLQQAAEALLRPGQRRVRRQIKGDEPVQ